MHSGLLRRATVVAALAAGVATSRAAAQDVAGEYVLEVAGQQVLALKLDVGTDGSLAGMVWRGTDSARVTGIRRGAGAFFVTTSPDGDMLHWEAVPDGDGLALTLVSTGPDGRPDYASAEQHRLERGSVAGAKASLLSRAIAIADSIVSWCIQAEATESSFCRGSIELLESMRPGLEVARLAAGEAPSSPPRHPLRPHEEAMTDLIAGRAVQVVSKDGGIEHLITFCPTGTGSVASRDPSSGASETVGMTWQVATASGAAEVVLLFDDGEEIRLPIQQSHPGYVQLGDAVTALEEAQTCE